MADESPDGGYIPKTTGRTFRSGEEFEKEFFPVMYWGQVVQGWDPKRIAHQYALETLNCVRQNLGMPLEPNPLPLPLNKLLDDPYCTPN